MRCLSLFLIFFAFLQCTHKRAQNKELSLFQLSTQKPSNEFPQSIGSYTEGCLKGGVALRNDSPYYDVLNLSRGRFWAHPDTIKALETIARNFFQNASRKMLIADLGHARGGPTLTGHRSHQNGLDADIWFRSIPMDKDLSLQESETHAPHSVINATSKKLLNGKLNRRSLMLLKSSAQNKNVERIFVHPSIKKYLCEKQKELDLKETFLTKIRPWWGHHEHFHLRFRCPKSDANCISQAPIEDKGCGRELEWWFSEEAQFSSHEKPSPFHHYKEIKKKLPTECKKLLQQ